MKRLYNYLVSIVRTNSMYLKRGLEGFNEHLDILRDVAEERRDTYGNLLEKQVSSSE